jgi:hypothetical protein
MLFLGTCSSCNLAIPSLHGRLFFCAKKVFCANTAITDAIPMAPLEAVIVRWLGCDIPVTARVLVKLTV